MNWSTFAFVGDRAFGESFGSLTDDDYHPWVALICGSAEAVSIFGSIKQQPWIDVVWNLIIGSFWVRAMRQFPKSVIGKVDRRVSRKIERNVFLNSILEYDGTSKGMTKDELYLDAALLVMAGTETSTTTLTGTIYHLTRHPDVLIPFQSEICTTFASKEEITIKDVSDIPNLLAVLNKSMRMYPSAAVTNPRRVPFGGAFVTGT